MRSLPILLLTAALQAQVYSPKLLRDGQADASDPRALAASIYHASGARTPRERAEAIWRFFLTDGRFVKPGFWYHIAGWAYEEPGGEVLDPVKLMNSYGFGLCYQIAPLLEAVWRAGGFEDARVWFLTGHTVAEVFYDSGYHYYDSDMMGYNISGSHVASVHEIENDGRIILSKMKGPREVDRGAVSEPWYPADVRAAAIPDLASLFTTRHDNWLFPFERAPAGHTMDFVLRPGERLVRYFEPEGKDLYYLPYHFDGREWTEFPREIDEYKIRTRDGPRSQKDSRRWATGRLEFRPQPARAGVYDVSSPYVIIDAAFDITAALPAGRTLALETSTDGGRAWIGAGTVAGPFEGRRRIEAAELTRSAHGRRTAVSGTYGYLLRVSGDGLRDLSVVTRVQLNPRTLPEVTAGRNDFTYSPGPRRVRRELTPAEPEAAGARRVIERGQQLWLAAGDQPGDVVYRIGEPAETVAAGGRFLDLAAGLAPDKFTAEVRSVAKPAFHAPPAASIAWSTSRTGPFRTVWEYDAKPRWRDGQAIDRVLAWPEADRRIETGGAREIFVRYRIRGMALDQVRFATETPARASSELIITHRWKEDGVSKSHTETVARETRYSIGVPRDAKVENEQIVFECPPPRVR